MPTRLPWALVASGLAGTALRTGRQLLRHAFVALCWGGLLPYLTVQPFHLYFGWSVAGALPHLRATPGPLLDSLFGAVLMLLCLLGTLGMVLLRDYMLQYRLFDFLAAGPAPAPAAEPADDALADALLAPGEDRGWLQSVSPREYRAFLRRRDYHRERSERHRVQHHELHSQRNEEMLRMLAAGLTDAEASVHSGRHTLASGADWETATERTEAAPRTERTLTDTLNPYGLDTSAGPAGSVGDFTEASASRRGAALRAEQSGITFRENFRCRICQKRSCVSREHVVLASQRGRDAEPPPPPADEPAAPHDGWLNMLGGQEHAEPLTLAEFFGLAGPLAAMLANWVVVLAALQVLVHWLAIVPLVTGMLLVDGSLPVGLSWLRAAGLRLWAYTGHVQPDPALLARVASARGALHAAAATAVRLWDHAVGTLERRVPAVGWAGCRPAAVRTLLQTVRPLVVPAATPAARALLKVAVGYAAMLAVSAGLYAGLLRCSRPYSRPTRQLLHVLCLAGCFAKLLAVNVAVLLLFPLYSGWLLDLCTLALFRQTLLARLQFHSAHPLLCTAAHYLPGLLFSVALGLLVKRVRTAVRPGLLHFIRNNDDPDYRPLRDVLEQPLADQLLAMTPTLAFYAAVIVFLVGAPTAVLTRLFPSLAPLYFNFKDPLSSLPMDFILQAAGMVVMDLVNPYFVKQLLPLFFAAALRRLRLSSYVLGGRFLPEESFPRGGRWVFVPDFDRLYRRDRLRAIALRQVQPMDIARLPIRAGRPNAPAAERPADAPQLPQPRRSIVRRPMARAREESSKGFTVVFRPNSLAWRMLALAAALFAYWLLTLTTFAVVPVLLGRRLLALFVDGRVHDTYTFSLGFLLTGVLVRSLVDLAHGVHASDPALIRRVCLHGPWTLAKAAVCALFVLVAWPLLFGTYLLLAVSPLLGRLAQLRVGSLVEVWSLGMIVVRYLTTVGSPFLARRHVDAVRKLKADGLACIDLPHALRALLLPVTAKTLLLLLEPGLWCLAAARLLGLADARTAFVQSYAYLLCALRPVAVHAVRRALQLRAALATKIRDEHYLVENRLRNLEPSAPGSPGSAGGARPAAPASLHA